MSQVAAFKNNSYPQPVYGLPFVAVFPILDNTGALVSGADGLDSERSLNGDTPVDCTNEATEIGSSGMYYLVLTNVETATNILTVYTKTSTTNAKTTPMVFYPKLAITITNDTCQGGSSSTVTLASTASAIDQFYRGMLIQVTIDGTDEYRQIYDYIGSTKVATVSLNWVTAAPDSNDPYLVYAAEDLAVAYANVVAWNSAAVATPATAGIPDVNMMKINNTPVNGDGGSTPWGP